MIRINLLGARNRRAARRSPPSACRSMEVGDGGGSPMLQVSCWRSCSGGLAQCWLLVPPGQRKKSNRRKDGGWRSRRTANWLTSRHATWSASARPKTYKRRVDVIDQLRANQTGPVNLLAMIGETVNGTEAVWLNSMQGLRAPASISTAWRSAPMP